MFLPATASIKRLLTPLAPRPIVILPPITSPHPKHCILLTLTIMPVQVFTHSHTDLTETPHTHMHMTHIHRAHKDKHVNSFSHTHTHTLTGVDAFAVTDLLKAQAGQIHASSLSQRMLLWKCLQLSLIFFFFFFSSLFSFPPHTHTHTLPILKTFTHNIEHNIHLHNRCPQRKTALKNSHRWCYTPPASVTS